MEKDDQKQEITQPQEELAGVPPVGAVSKSNLGAGEYFTKIREMVLLSRFKSHAIYTNRKHTLVRFWRTRARPPSSEYRIRAFTAHRG